MQKIIEEAMSIHNELAKIGASLIELFNKGNPIQYDGDLLFQPTSSSICKYWKPREKDEQEELFMNFNCGHPDADRDWGEGDNCCIAGCPDEKDGTQIAGQITALHSQIHPVMMATLGLFNNYKHFCEYCVNKTRECSHLDNKEKDCCAANCPL